MMVMVDDDDDDDDDAIAAPRAGQAYLSLKTRHI